VAAGLVALFFRELALPYAGLAAVLAWRGGRRGELAAWVTGLALYAVFLTLHAVAVAPRIPRTDDILNVSHWSSFGGTAFVLGTCRMNVFLAASPAWVAAFYLPLSLLGLAGWREEIGTRCGLAAGLYLALFVAVGNPFNAYWGLLYAPLLSFGAALAPAALRDLCGAVSAEGRVRPAVARDSISKGRTETDSLAKT
jgi:hypothetical protein